MGRETMTTLPSRPGVGALVEVTRSETDLRRFLHGLPGVDQVGAEARAAALATRSIKTTSKLWAIDIAIAMVDLTTLEGADTPGKVRSLCAKATPARPRRRGCAPRRCGVRLPRPRRRRREALRRLARSAVASRGDGIPVRAGLARRQAGRRARGRRGRRRRDRHGDRPRRVPPAGGTGRSSTRSWRSRRPAGRRTSR